MAAMAGAGSLAAAESPGIPGVKVMQVTGDGKPIGTPREAPCPANGCQLAVTLQLSGGTPLAVNAIVTFVAEGIYVTVDPVGAGATRIHEYGNSGPAILFLPGRTSQPLSRVVGLTVERGSSRGMVSVEPDAYLRLEFAARAAIPQN
jgi:hypothetical protein